MRNPNEFEAIDPAALARVNGGMAQMLSMIGPIIGMLGQRRKKGPTQMAAAPGQPPPGQPPGRPPGGQPPPQTASSGGDAGSDGRIQVTVATGPTALELAKSIGAPTIA